MSCIAVLAVAALLGSDAADPWGQRGAWEPDLLLEEADKDSFWDVTASVFYTAWSPNLRLRNGAGYGLTLVPAEGSPGSGRSYFATSFRFWRVDDFKGGGEADVVFIGFSGAWGVSAGFHGGLGGFMTAGVTGFFGGWEGGPDRAAPTYSVGGRAIFWTSEHFWIDFGVTGDAMVTDFNQDRTRLLFAFSMVVSCEVPF